MAGTHMCADGTFGLVHGTNITSAVRFCRYRPDKSSVHRNVPALGGMGMYLQREPATGTLRKTLLTGN